MLWPYGCKRSQSQLEVTLGSLVALSLGLGPCGVGIGWVYMTGAPRRRLGLRRWAPSRHIPGQPGRSRECGPLALAVSSTAREARAPATPWLRVQSAWGRPYCVRRRVALQRVCLLDRGSGSEIAWICPECYDIIKKCSRSSLALTRHKFRSSREQNMCHLRSMPICFILEMDWSTLIIYLNIVFHDRDCSV